MDILFFLVSSNHSSFFSVNNHKTHLPDTKKTAPVSRSGKRRCFGGCALSRISFDPKGAQQHDLYFKTPDLIQCSF